MKTKIIATTVVALASLSSVSAFAGGDSQDFFSTPAATSTASRAQVQADYSNAQKAGTFTRGGDSADFFTAQAPTTTLTRSQVRAEGIVASHTPLASEYLGTN